MTNLRTDVTREQLLELARKIGSGGALPSARTLREQLGISNATLGAALEELAARGQIIRKPGSGIYVSPTLDQRRLALAVNPEFFAQAGVSPFWGQLLLETRRRAEARGEALFLHFAERSIRESEPLLPPGLTEEVSKGRLVGVLAIGLTHPQARWIEAQGVPVVAFAGAARYLVQLAMEELVQSGVAALARSGCQRLALLAPTETPQTSVIFRAACTAHALTGQVLASTEAPSHAGRGWELARQARTTPCDGVLSLDDTLTQGFLMHLHHTNTLSKITVATHANAGSPTLLGWEDKLIRLEFDPAAIVSGLFSCLDALIAGTVLPDTQLIGDAGFPPIYSEPIHALTLSPKLILPQENQP
ncbi:GntR family transcriptional regulator [Armatimonas sp.]|uniref:GntR family transcriptional regulator n=1 Tax=Armatimonas sp. TaxID=1872638 RepID=UPI00286C8A53|nr:GntR family transcriptional regulator [Armatimonas sp.]